jgi:Fe2+ or Zn2+ uptake regulation protein
MYPLQDLLNHARRHGLRITRQRAIILQALCELEGHASAEAVYERVTLHRRDVDLSTVYRTLETLHNLDIVSQTDLGHGCSEYEIVGDQPHHHLVCQDCGCMVELDDVYLVPLVESIRQEFGFEPTSSHFAIFGTCQACLEKQEQATAGGAGRPAGQGEGEAAGGGTAPASNSFVRARM